MKRNKRKTLINKLDKAWSERIREGKVCEVCGKTPRPKGLHPHHVVSRVYRRLRWDLRNGIRLCAYCHVFSHKFSAHKTPEAFKRWFAEHRPKDWEYLQKVKNESGKFTISELEEKLKKL